MTVESALGAGTDVDMVPTQQEHPVLHQPIGRFESRVHA